MTSATSGEAPARSAPGSSASASTSPGGAGGGLVTSQGRTTIADTVVQKIAGRAAREVSGVHDFGGGAARTFGAIAERIPGARASSGQGVSVEVGEKQAAVDLDVVVEYGVPIGQLAQSIRRNVITAIEQMTGLDVVEVNINVNDLHLPEVDGGGEPSEPSRVR
ncbi:MAG: Asp23/Gls24 family envelope stress response protein [Pseudonocardiaceae bacterium]